MKAIMIMFDTLSRRYLSTYGNEWVHTPNFERLKKQSVQFNTFFAGSLPCMPARREIQTGRYNFLHRGWGPIEPYDVCSMELLKAKGIYTHICTDHSHYWEDGGATYLPRYSSWEGFRGQEGDRWVGCVNAKQRLVIPKQGSTTKMQESFYVNYANRTRMEAEKDFSGVQTFEAGMRFIEENKSEDQWFLQVECFDPHEPFYVPQRFLDLYEQLPIDVYFDWPTNSKVCESKEEQRQVMIRYAALISMCDEYLGKMLDKFDQYDLWKDTMLIVNTDHGFLMGEHDWWGKNIQPLYNEVTHLPFYLYDPRVACQGERNALAQTIDIAPTLLEYFGVEVPETMQGKPLSQVIKEDKTIHTAGLFGSFGGAVNVTDGKHVYLHSCLNAQNQPIYEYTLMPTKLRGFLSNNSLKKTTLTNEFACFDHMNVLKVPSKMFISHYHFGNKLFDLTSDPSQENELENDDLELEMIEKMRVLMIENEAPHEQFERMGIPEYEEMTLELLQVQKAQRVENERLPITFQVSKIEKTQILLVRDLMDESQRDGLFKRLEANHEKHAIFDLLVEATSSIFQERGLNQYILGMFINTLRNC